MSQTYTYDVFMTLDGWGSYNESGDWGGYWGKHGRELLDHRVAIYGEPCRMVFGATTMKLNIEMLGPSTSGAGVPDPWVAHMRDKPATVVSSTMEGLLDWPDLTIERGDAVEVVSRLKEGSDVPIRSHRSLTLNRALLAAGLVDAVEVTVFPVISGQTGSGRVFEGAADLDLDLLDSRTFDGRTQQLTYRPSRHR